MTLPNFLIIGAMKAGTTALFDNLEQHPEIYTPSVKEPHFFSTYGQSDLPPLEGETKFINTLDEYQNLFEGVSHEKAYGEASTSYLVSPHAARQIKELTPQIKLICLLRNPVERAYSHYLFLRRDDLETIDDFGRALQEETKRRQQQWPWGYYHYHGLYATHLQVYYELFEPEQIQVYLFDDFSRDPVAVTQDVYRFLGVDETFIPDTSIRRNPSGIPKNQWMHSLLVKDNPIKRYIQPRLPRSVYRAATKLRDKNLAKPQMEPEIRVAVVSSYREEIYRLQDMLSLDLATWLQ